MGSAVSWGDPQPLEWCAGHEGWEGGECNCGGWVLHLESWAGGGVRGRACATMALVFVCLQAVPEMTELLKKK